MSQMKNLLNQLILCDLFNSWKKKNENSLQSQESIKILSSIPIQFSSSFTAEFVV